MGCEKGVADRLFIWGGRRFPLGSRRRSGESRKSKTDEGIRSGAHERYSSQVGAFGTVLMINQMGRQREEKVSGRVRQPFSREPWASAASRTVLASKASLRHFRRASSRTNHSRSARRPGVT